MPRLLNTTAGRLSGGRRRRVTVRDLAVGVLLGAVGGLVLAWMGGVVARWVVA